MCVTGCGILQLFSHRVHVIFLFSIPKYPQGHRTTLPVVQLVIEKMRYENLTFADWHGVPCEFNGVPPIQVYSQVLHPKIPPVT